MVSVYLIHNRELYMSFNHLPIKNVQIFPNSRMNSSSASVVMALFPNGSPLLTIT